MEKKHLKNRLTAIFFLLFSNLVFSQTDFWEQKVVENFSVYITDINKHLSPILNRKDRSALSKVKVQIDTSGTDYTANSDSKRKTITFSRNLIKSIVRFSVAQLIDFDTVDFNRKRFAGFYTSIYPYLNSSMLPEDAAELTKEQFVRLEKLGNTHEFRWIVEQKIMFIYLHELSHQFQDYSNQFQKIDKKNISQLEKDSLLFQLEIEADNFATSNLAKMDIDPTQCEDILSFFSFIKETRFTTVQQIAKRQINFFQFCFEGFGCNSLNDDLCQKIRDRYLGFIKLDYHYTKMLNSDSLKIMHEKAVTNLDVYAIYNLADFYFKGTSDHISNLDLAMYYYELGANLILTNNNLYGAKNQEQLISIIEYCQVLSSRIYELKLNNKQSALKYLSMASETAVFLPKEYYERTIKRLKEN